MNLFVSYYIIRVSDTFVLLVEMANILKYVLNGTQVLNILTTPEYKSPLWILGSQFDGYILVTKLHLYISSICSHVQFHEPEHANSYTIFIPVSPHLPSRGLQCLVYRLKKDYMYCSLSWCQQTVNIEQHKQHELMN